MKKIDNEQETAKQYEPLVHKIASQFYNKLPSSNEDILGWAWLGLATAMKNYKPKSTQSFMQFAAYQIRFSILNGNNNTGHIVKFTAYYQEKAKKDNLSTCIWERLDANVNEDGDEYIDYDRMPQFVVHPTYDSDIDTTTIMDKIYDTVEHVFSRRDCDIFYKFNGLHDEVQMKGKDIARQYHISTTLVSLTNKRIMDYLKENISGNYMS